MHPHRTQKRTLTHQHTHKNAQYMCKSIDTCHSHIPQTPKYAPIPLEPGMTRRSQCVAKAGISAGLGGWPEVGGGIGAPEGQWPGHWKGLEGQREGGRGHRGRKVPTGRLWKGEIESGEEVGMCGELPCSRQTRGTRPMSSPLIFTPTL